MQELIYAESPAQTLSEAVAALKPDAVFCLADSHTARHCVPLLEVGTSNLHVFPAGENSKQLHTLADVLRWLSVSGCTRHSLLVNIGGGVVTDLGGFAASIFKRGIRFVNIPTSLLAMVDASVGGKTGIDFNGCKNEIGCFAPATQVIVAPSFLQTLDVSNFLSGYAEMFKHSLLIGHGAWERHVSFLANLSPGLLGSGGHLPLLPLRQLIEESIAFKQRIVENDPTEHGPRKSLNLGHTMGHAIESLLLAKETPVLHGYAVAWGLIVSLFLSAAMHGFPTEVLRASARFVAEYYGRPGITCDDYEELFRIMLHDKKNISGQVRFTLLEQPGKVVLDATPDLSLIGDALDFLREA